MAKRVRKRSPSRKTAEKDAKRSRVRKRAAHEQRKREAPVVEPKSAQSPSKRPVARNVTRVPNESAPTIEAVAQPALYDANDIVDAEEFHGLSRALGNFTWGTWDVGVRPFEERKLDFLCAYPPCHPTSRSGGRLQRQDDGTFAPGRDEHRLARFLSDSWDHGTLNELLSRFGLRMRNASGHREYLLKLDSLKDVAKRRNVRLRVLHGGVDVEPANMDAAKAEYLDRKEKQQAARDVRAARARMQEELSEIDGNGNR